MQKRKLNQTLEPPTNNKNQLQTTRTNKYEIDSSTYRQPQQKTYPETNYNVTNII